MKKNVQKILFMITAMFLFIDLTYALTLSENNVKIPAGENKNITLSINTDKTITSLEFVLVFDSYDIPASFTPSSGFRDNNPNGIKHIIIFNTPVTGKIDIGTINVRIVPNPKVQGSMVNLHSAKGKSNDGGTVTFKDQAIKVDIGEEEEKEIIKSNFLKEIESSIVDIKLEKDVYLYEVSIDDTVDELDLDGIPIDDTYKVSISNQKISELDDKTITISIDNNDGIKEEYKIKVNVKEKKDNITKKKDNKKNTGSYKNGWILPIIIFGVLLFLGVIINKNQK